MIKFNYALTLMMRAIILNLHSLSARADVPGTAPGFPVIVEATTWAPQQVGKPWFTSCLAVLRDTALATVTVPMPISFVIAL